MMKLLAFLMAACMLRATGLPNYMIRADHPPIEDTTGKGIAFEEGLSWQQIKEKAIAGNKHIFLDIYATWCGPCKQMDKEVYPNDTVGRFMNAHFISVKVQMDSSKKDNEAVRRWYKDARDIGQTYPIMGYPSFLFISPDGELVYKEEGFKNVQDFIKVGEKALAPETRLYYSKLEAYKKGAKEGADPYQLASYAQLLGETKLARQIAADYISRVDRNQLLSREKILWINNVAGNRSLADSIARIYKSSYLDQLNEDELCKKENFDFIRMFTDLVQPQDPFFQLLYHQPGKIDRVTGIAGYKQWFAKYVIKREELENRLWKSGKPVFKYPDWANITAAIRQKYPAIDPGQLVADYQIQYFKRLKDSAAVAELLVARIDKFGPYDPVYEAEAEPDFMLNNAAWMIFEYSDKEDHLRKALAWSDSAVNIARRRENQAGLSNWMDTKANILYKLGRRQEAIALETQALALAAASDSKKIRETLKKMKKGQPTWPD